jgi:hypothetical protein
MAAEEGRVGVNQPLLTNSTPVLGSGSAPAPVLAPRASLPRLLSGLELRDLDIVWASWLKMVSFAVPYQYYIV